MKKKVFNFILLSSLLSLIAMSNCANDRGTLEDKRVSEDQSTSPPEPPASEYPGNHTDSMHHSSHADSIQPK